MEQWLAGGSCLLSLLLVLSTIVAGWLVLWHTTLKDIGFFREIMGLNRPKPEVKAQRQASMKAEIEKIKRQHSRSRTASVRSASRPDQQQQQQQHAVPQGS
ncbi:hypothetical protein OEZ86_013711 [Tetradesmus obliquus]|nr:hypothetical protein OEZ86_013711 [Tetradesmus obliquus]